jgi:hypothetical protein
MASPTRSFIMRWLTGLLTVAKYARAISGSTSSGGRSIMDAGSSTTLRNGACVVRTALKRASLSGKYQ